jgi:2-dehydro-3-deoxyphosphogluconate aldolase/(4S)-4-hydroxy-2-oxoglutarate aldolase
MSADVAQAIERDGVVAIVRLDDLSGAVGLAEALGRGGVRVVEFTFTNPLAGQAIERVNAAAGKDTLVGAGSVLDAETARTAILAGARFVVTPVVSLPVIACCNRYGVPTVIGAFTPTEILTAWEAGATFVKVFPASAGGPRYLKDVRGPLPQVKLIPTGGVGVEKRRRLHPGRGKRGGGRRQPSRSRVGEGGPLERDRGAGADAGGCRGCRERRLSPSVGWFHRGRLPFTSSSSSRSPPCPTAASNDRGRSNEGAVAWDRNPLASLVSGRSRCSLSCRR